MEICRGAHGEHLDSYIIAYFPMDSFILKYLEGGYSYAPHPHYDAEEIQKHILGDGRARIGGIDIGERRLEHTESEVAIAFTAVPWIYGTQALIRTS